MAFPAVIRLLARGSGRGAYRLVLELLHHGFVHLGRRGGAATLMARRDWLEAGGIALAPFALYAATAPRTLAPAAAGVFVSGAAFLGTGPPPGSPRFCGHGASSSCAGCRCSSWSP